MSRSLTLVLTGTLGLLLAACGDDSIPTAASNDPASSLATSAPLQFRSRRVPTPNSEPRHLTQGSDGNLWFTESNLDVSQIGRLDASGRVTEFVVPTRFGQPDDIVSGPDGALWFTQPSGFPDAYVVRLTTDGAFTQFAPECDVTYGCSIVPNGITNGPDGNVWFTEYVRNAVVRLTPSGVFTFFTIPTPGANPSGITVGPDGALWFAEFNRDKIGRIDPATGDITEFGPATGGPYRIVAGPDGNLWFTDPFNDTIGRFTPPSPSAPDGAFVAFPLPSPSNPRDITVGPDGNLWFTEYSAGQLSRITLDGVIRQVLSVSGGPWGIAGDADGAIWVAPLEGNRIGRLRLDP